MPKSLNLVYQVGDSVSFDIKGHYVSAIYEEMPNALDKMATALFTAKSDNASSLISKGNNISPISLSTLFDDNAELTSLYAAMDKIKMRFGKEIIHLAAG